jgi:hypothetical protein
MRAVRHCYENSLEERDPDVSEATEGVRQLAANLNSKKRFPRVAVQRGRNPKWSDGQIGLHRFDGRKWETLLARDRLHHLCGDCTSESAVFQRLLRLEVVKQGGYSSASEQLRVRSPGGDIKRVRFWKVDVGKLRQWRSNCARSAKHESRANASASAGAFKSPFAGGRFFTARILNVSDPTKNVSAFYLYDIPSLDARPRAANGAAFNR